MNVTRRKWLYQIFNHTRQGFSARVINLGLMFLILANVTCIIASSEPAINAQYGDFFYYFEIISVIIFTIEYLSRVWASVEESDNRKSYPLKSRIRYMLTPMAIVDLLAILPSYFLFLGSDFLVLRTLRLIRVLKLTRYSRSMELLITVSKQEAETIISAIFILVILIIVSATGIYIVEGDIQPEEFGSIPRALWWATVTLTTVGYGDVVPITTLGRALGIIIVITGVGMAALPAGIMASGFTTEIGRRRERFKSAIMAWVEDGTFNKHEGHEFTVLQEELGISRADASIMLRDAKAEFRRNKHKYEQHTCPKCGFVNKSS